MLTLDQSPMIALVAARLRALADETRLKILLALKPAPRPVGELVELLAIPQPSISKHLAVLKAAGLVEARREANQIFYRIRDQSVFDMCALVCDGVTRHIQAQHADLHRHEPPRAPLHPQSKALKGTRS
jgi:DNA-binding transcriptional ArsR family regulator